VHWTYVHTGHAINALFRVYHYLIFQFIEARDWAHLYAVGEFASVTFVRHYMSHRISKVEDV
jgi:hypothetical protein